MAQIETLTISAPLAGVIRGLTRDGVRVSPGTKVIEIAPRVDMPNVEGIGERPARIAEGVHEAIRLWRSASAGDGRAATRPRFEA